MGESAESDFCFFLEYLPVFSYFLVNLTEPSGFTRAFKFGAAVVESKDVGVDNKGDGVVELSHNGICDGECIEDAAFRDCF